jgi:hypothetical protein
MSEGIDIVLQAILVGIFEDVNIIFLLDFVAELDHFFEFPGGIDMEIAHGRLDRIESLKGQIEHNPGILADGIHNNGILRLGNRLAKNVYAFVFEIF